MRSIIPIRLYDQSKQLISALYIIAKSKRPNTLTADNVRLSNLLIGSYVMISNEDNIVVFIYYLQKVSYCEILNKII